MAKKRSGGESTMGYFRRVFTEHKQWLNEKSNDAVLAKYREDHNLEADADVSKIKNSLANVKSVLRKKLRGGGKGGPGGVRTIKVVAAKGHAKPARSLETLEEMIDDCMTLARNLEMDKHDAIYRHLRAARNEVVWRGGQK